ncbi:hypothetical protein BDR07DRAFT_1422607 [Suillus spraguei]|nr:hypothetical protein BDR07DRAFT_1422607 [Suillus spraguei]
MSSSGPTLAQIEVAGIILTIVAVIATSFRLFIRAQRKHLWIDDACAALGMIFNFMLSIVDCLRYKYHVRVAHFFNAVVWTSRLSILFTIVRLTVPGTIFRRVLICTAITFGIFWALLFSQVWWVCESEPSWKIQPHPQCDLGRAVAITQMITDVLGDSILISVPFFLIYNIRLSRPQKVRVLTAFSASSITTIVSLVHAYYIFSSGRLKEVMAAIVEASMSLIVANFGVVVAKIPSTSTPIITFGSQPRKRFRDPLATTFVGAESTPIVLEDLSESLPYSMKASDDENSMNNGEEK